MAKNKDKELDNKKIFELVFNEVGTDKIDEVFGVNQDVANQIEEKFVKWLAFEEHSSFTRAWADYLESDVFKKIGFEPKTPNDYFVLGGAFKEALYTYRRKMRQDGAGILSEILGR